MKVSLYRTRCAIGDRKHAKVSISSLSLGVAHARKKQFFAAFDGIIIIRMDIRFYIN